MKSVWSDFERSLSFNSLEGDFKTNTLIIGGGIAGILCSHFLRSAGIDCAVVESNRIFSGVTENTTAKISIQHGLIFHRVLHSFGEEKARLFLKAHQKALTEYEKLFEKISCDYEKKDSFVYSLTDRRKIEKEIEALDRLGLKADFLEEVDLPLKIKGAVRIKNQGQFHPLKFAMGISEDLLIFENTKVLELKKNKAVTNRGEIFFENLIVATHFPIFNKHGLYPLKMFQHRSYVVALEAKKNVNGIYVDEDEKGLSFRNYKDFLILGGGAHRTGKSGGGWRELEAFAEKNFPEAEISYRWAAQDCMTLDGVSYIGQYSKNTPNVYVTTGFNKWGFTSAMVSALLLSDLISGKESPFSSVFSPSRTMLRPQLAVNTFESLLGLLTPTVPRCPHLGCALKYNKEEHSWDCSCHGSRFNEEGKLLDSPATADLKKKPKK